MTGGLRETKYDIWNLLWSVKKFFKKNIHGDSNVCALYVMERK